MWLVLTAVGLDRLALGSRSGEKSVEDWSLVAYEEYGSRSLVESARPRWSPAWHQLLGLRVEELRG